MSERRPASIETSDPDWATTAFVGILGTVVLVIVIVFVQGLYGRTSRSEFTRKVVAEEPLEYRDLHAKQLAQLQETGWVDRKNGVVAIPIEKAMALMAADPNPAAPVGKKP
jgi:hypothetical protein